MNNCIAENPVLEKQTMTEFRLDELEKAVRELQERIEQLEAARE